MEIVVTENDYCKLEVKYEADKEQIDDKRVEVLSLFKKAPVPGFRQGKANIEVIKVHYKKQIEEALKRALAEEAFHNTMFEKNVKPLGQPDFSSILLQGHKFTCAFSVHKKPDFELAQYKDFEIPKPVRQFSVEDLTEKMLEDLRVQQGEMVPYTENDVVENGDKIIISYTGSIDGVVNEAVSEKAEFLTVGSSPIKEFDDNLLGMKIGETRKFSIKVPETGLPSFKGKEIEFELSMSMGSKINKIALDDSLAKRFGKETMEELRELVVAEASKKVEESERSDISKQISARLVENHDFKVPDWLTLSEAQYLAASSKKVWNELPEMDQEALLKVANQNVKLALVLDRIRDKEPEAQLSDQEVISIIKGSIQHAENADDKLKEMNDSGYLSILIARLRDENTLDFILKNSKIVD